VGRRRRAFTNTLQSVWQLNFGERSNGCPVFGVHFYWDQSLRLRIPEDWTTGIYLAKFENDDGYDSYFFFAVKDDRRVADFYYQQPITTYQAYNAFPDDGVNGKNAYDAFSWGGSTVVGSPRAVRLSFDRPMENTGAERFFMHEHDLIMFLEEHGYDVGYHTG